MYVFDFFGQQRVESNLPIEGNVCNTVVESAVKRLKLNTEAMAEVWRHGDETDTLLGLFKTLKCTFENHALLLVQLLTFLHGTASTVEDVQKWKDLMETTENDISVVENALRSLANTSESNEEFYATLHSLSQAKSINVRAQLITLFGTIILQHITFRRLNRFVLALGGGGDLLIQKV